MTLTKQIQNLTLTNQVTLEKLIPVTTKADNERAESIRLLKMCISQVGQHLGEPIEKHIAEMEGTYFSSLDYHYERMSNSQKV